MDKYKAVILRPYDDGCQVLEARRVGNLYLIDKGPDGQQPSRCSDRKPSQITRDLTHNDADWKWTIEHERSFNTLKAEIANEATLTFFSKSRPTILTVDASPIGLGAVLKQRQSNNTLEPVAFASRLLTDTERRYSQSEREALAVVWAVEHFNIYLL